MENAGEICGNQIVESLEQCDDGNSDDNDGCTTTCELTEDVCPNGDDSASLYDGLCEEPIATCDISDLYVTHTRTGNSVTIQWADFLSS